MSSKVWYVFLALIHSLRIDVFLGFFLISHIAFAGPNLIDLNEFTRDRQIEQTIPEFGRVEILNSVENSAYEESQQEIKLKLNCNQPVGLIQGRGEKIISQTSFRVWSAKSNGQRTWIHALNGQSDLSCHLRGEGFDISLVSEGSIYPEVAKLRAQEIPCRPMVNGKGCVWNENSASVENSAEVLKNPYEAFNARFKMLMGYEISQADFANKNPNMNLEFSRAPKLDLIIVDTLQILKDFVGVLTLRMIEWHARHGTRVYFMTSRALLLSHEGGWLKDFVNNNPNIHFSLFTSIDERESKTPSKTTPADYLNSIHRNNHIKVFLTLSESQPEANAFIAGGRNFSELYFYDMKPDNTKYPELIQWGQEPFYGWVYFDDLDFKLTDVTAARQVAKALLNFNEKRILPHPVMKNNSEQKNIDFGVSTLHSGFLMAFPFDENRGQLERAYVDLIDSSQSSLEVFTPYVNLTKNIRDAFSRAHARGVHIHIITNINLAGDFMPGFLQPAMNRSLRKVIGTLRISYYNRTDHIMHVKSMLIDNKKLILGSVNLNRRSFNHDSEISVIFSNPRVIQDFKNQMDRAIMPWVSPLQRSDMPPKTLMEFLIGPFMGLM